MQTAASRLAMLTTADPGWDEARLAWNLTEDQRPAAIARPGSAQSVLDAVGYARHHGLRTAAQGTGHNAPPLGDLSGTLLVKTGAMWQVSVDPGQRIVRAEAGALSQEVTEAAARYGLAALTGTSPDVSVVGYTVGGGMSWLEIRPGRDQCRGVRGGDRPAAGRRDPPRRSRHRDGDDPRWRPARCTSTSPRPGVTRPASGTRRPTVGCGRSRPRSTPEDRIQSNHPGPARHCKLND